MTYALALIVVTALGPERYEHAETFASESACWSEGAKMRKQLEAFGAVTVSEVRCDQK